MFGLGVRVFVVEFARLSCHVIVASDLSPISGLISDDALKQIFHRFKLIVTTLILDGCHRITGKSLAVIEDSKLQNASFKWCDGIKDAEMLSHLETRRLCYSKIDLRGCHKITGVPLFEECVKKAIETGMLKPDAIFASKDLHHTMFQFTSPNVCVFDRPKSIDQSLSHVRRGALCSPVPCVCALQGAQGAVDMVSPGRD